MYRYAIEIFYNEEDDGHIAVVPELPGCSAFGETEEEALKVDLWLETAEKDRREMGTSQTHRKRAFECCC